MLDVDSLQNVLGSCVHDDDVTACCNHIALFVRLIWAVPTVAAFDSLGVRTEELGCFWHLAL